MKRVEYYRTESGKEPCRDWLLGLDSKEERCIRAYVDRVAAGAGRKNIKPVGEGVFEIKIDYGPGYRVYFGEVGKVLILLLVGGDKGTQFRDIRQAKEYWRNHGSK